MSTSAIAETVCEIADSDFWTRLQLRIARRADQLSLRRTVGATREQDRMLWLWAECEVLGTELSE